LYTLALDIINFKFKLYKIIIYTTYSNPVSWAINAVT